MQSQVYLLLGPEVGECSDEIKKIKASLKKKYNDSVEEYLYLANETPPEEYIKILQNGSLFSSSICVVVKNAEEIKKKEDVALISNWIKSNPSEENVLILVSEDYSVDKSLEKAFLPQNKHIFYEMNQSRLTDWVRSYFYKNGYTISEDGIATILELIENNTDSIRNECSRFFVLFPKEHEISVEDVDSILAHTRSENAFSLFDAMCSNIENTSQCFEHSLDVLQKIRLSKENSSVMIIAALASCFRKLSTWIKLENDGKNDDFNLKINGFTSKKMRSQYSRAARTWSQGQVAGILSNLASADMNIRSGGSSFEDILLQNIVYEIVVKKGATSSRYQDDVI